MINIDLELVDGNFGFTARDAEDHQVQIDAAEGIGGKGSGVRPMQLLLMGMGGCSGIDILSILRKQRVQVDHFSIQIQAERESGKEPALWEKMHIIFSITANIDQSKMDKACALSIDKYCSVAATLRPGGTAITWEAKVITSPQLSN